MPWRRYQIPSFVSQASSASTVVPLVSRIMNPAPLFPPVDNGLELNCTGVGAAATAGVGVTLGDGDGEGDGDASSETGGGNVMTGACCVTA